ncbi:MAG TPA: AAA-like domain-containing protein [Pyrinomonadaceae bacterium]|nr:AAA-like domain-containing protein [Pyrinomonadaceae bacterium]
MSTGPFGSPRLDIAHVLFMDIVSYSRLPMDRQTRVLQQLYNVVRGTEEFRRAEASQQLIRLPTGDGMALVFFGDPESALRCALEVSRALLDMPSLPLRMGVHSGAVYRMDDINTSANVAGGGINTAQRVMDCGDAGHILVSKAVAEMLGELSTWNGYLHDLGEAEVKHGVRVHIYNVHANGLGNPELPEKLRKAAAPSPAGVHAGASSPIHTTQEPRFEPPPYTQPQTETTFEQPPAYQQQPSQPQPPPPTTTPITTTAEPLQSVTPTGEKRLRVALLYKRNAKPDEQVLKFLEDELTRRGYSVFIDRHLTIGVEWAKEIERQVRTADAVVPLLSPLSVVSEMLTYELQIAHEASQGPEGRPRILPIRINFEDALPDPLGGILAPIQYFLWRGPDQDRQLIAQLLGSLEGPKPAEVEPSEIKQPGGAVALDSKLYIVRPTDDEFLEAIRRRDSIVLVKGARQMGKTSLLARGMQQARAAGSEVVLTDFQKLNASHLDSIDAFFVALAEMLYDQLDLDTDPEDFWNAKRGASINFERYMRREVLKQTEKPLVWAMDEVDRLLTCPFGSEVFGLFRSWHNERQLDPSSPWERLTLAIVYATEPHLFITDPNQSPFNVGTKLELRDFTPQQAAELNARLGSPLRDPAEVARMYALLGGHPYLVHRGLYEMKQRGLSIDDFEATADRDEGPYGDHLRRILVLLARDPELTEIVRGVLGGQPCPTMDSFYRLRSAGLLTGDTAREVSMRCRLYENYLKRHLL